MFSVKTSFFARFLALAAMVLPAASMITAFSALAQEAAKSASNTWVVTLGGTVEYGPSYEGSKHLSFSGMPSFDFHRLGETPEYSAPDDNIDYSLFDVGGIEAGPVVGLRGGRSAFDDSDLNGLHRVHWNFDAGAFAQYWPMENQLRLRAEMRQALWGGDGLLADLSLDWFQPVGDRWLLSAGPRMSLANSTYMRNNFGISESEAAKNGHLDAFDANGGLKSVGFTVAATYTISPAWSVQVYNKYNRLVSDAADSPITSQIGSPNQNIIGFTLNRTFDVRF
ncbi:outer membrane scaffolding protein for murein synthesis (MipA/OmpV family) [Rhizobium sp. BK313]|uniref:MipA/OmpV family protein n=1 Tax=Rhizobium sp. BK313 TaxID=2587081 RepID=UPI0017EDB55F|nr:MipA/OmpV family protein [Rhizobium sp. BK313]MBB3456798.1 outer membrane scaffolding protein for murein synthesis (MipA/OmpV family) [Rhizobium sp. BK313]